MPDRPAHPRRSYANYAVRLGELVLARAEAAIAPLGIRALALDTLVCIKDGYGRSQQDLSARLGIYAPQMVGLIDGLEQKGLVERQVSSADRRRHTLVLTPAGEALLQHGLSIAEALEEELFGSLTAEEKARFGALVERLESAAAPLECDPSETASPRTRSPPSPRPRRRSPTTPTAPTALGKR